MKTMKKYLLMLAALITAILSSCSNDDLSVDTTEEGKVFTTTIKVDPSTVIKNFSYQLDAGEIEGIEENEQLRLRIYIFGADGTLCDKDMSTVRNYLTSSTFQFNLPYGNYTAIAITDITSTESGSVPEYWEVSEYTSINTMKVSYTQAENSTYGPQEILGISSSSFSVNADNTLSISIEPAGAVIFALIENIHAFEELGVDYIWIFTNRNNGFYDSFYSPSGFNAYPDLDNAATLYDMITTSTNKPGHYVNKFMMPQQNFQINLGMYNISTIECLAASTKDDLTIEKGKEYFYHVVLDSQGDGQHYSVDFSDVTGKTYTSRSGSAEMEVVSNAMAMYEPSFAKKAEKMFDLSAPKSYLVKELIK